ncbi:hypothetical protein GGF37_001691, partial [Kickxella alabastrina]
MITLVSAIGECLSQLDKGNFADSLGVLDRFELGRLDSGDNDVVDDDDDDDADRISVASSSSSGAASFCDASSSPVWYDIESSQQVPPLRLQNPLQHTTESMVQGLRHLIERQEALLNTKAMYEGHLSLMAVHLQKQSDKLAELGCPMPGETESGTDAPVDVFVNSPMLPYNASVIESPRDLAQQGVDRQQPANTPRWWSTFLPAGGTSSSPSEHSVAGQANWLPLAIALPHSITRKTVPQPAEIPVPAATEDDACLECIQACERVANAVINGDFSLRVQCSRCQTDEERAANDPAFPRRMAWLDLDRDATPPDGRPVTHTRRLAKRVNCMMSLLSFVTHQLFEVACNDGIRGKLGMQLISEGMSGTWLNLIKEVNMMSRIQTAQVRDITQVCNAVANGDLTRKVDIKVNGEMLALKTTINGMVDQLSAFSMEVTRVTHAVGTEGILGVSANVPGVNGVWKQLTDNVNNMADNITNQVRDISKVCKSVASGNLAQLVEVEAQGEMLELKTTINSMVTSIDGMAGELIRLTVEVGVHGMLGGQAIVPNVDGVWKDLTDNVNNMANNLTMQVRDITSVAKAVAAGDLTRKVISPLKGEMAELKSTINTLVDQLSMFAGEITRISYEVGWEGRLGTQAQVHGVSGVWLHMTDSMNNMAHNITHQLRTISEVTASVSEGDLGKVVDIHCQGEMEFLKNTINDMVGRLKTFSSEVSRVAKEVGTDGVLGGQAVVPDVEGIWKDLTDNVNKMANNLTIQVRDIANVTKAVAAGDLNQKVTSELNGEMGELKQTINDMVDQLSTFAAEVSRVAKEVGTDGVLGGQAKVVGVDGTWKILTDNVNKMADNLTIQVRDIANVTKAISAGDLTQEVTSELNGEMGELKSTINTMVDQLSTFAAEVSRVAKEVGTDGVLGGQAKVDGVDGVWKDLTDNVNNMANNLTIQVRDIAAVTKAVAAGDLTQKVTSELKGEMEELKTTINTMVGQLSTFAAEVSRVAKEVGTDGVLGGQAKVVGVDGTWKDLTDNVNKMANNLTIQVRDIANVTKAISAGDLTQEVTSELNGEMGELKSTINTMVDQLSTFAAEVSRVAKEVGTDGILGGQAKVEGVDGVWKDLTNNVNNMANNLTLQVRDIANVTKAVAAGDLTQKVTSELNGEMEELKSTINTMVDQLSLFADEVSRMAREVGTDGVLGGQAKVEGVGGVWKDLTDNVNKMADNLTLQVRDIANVTKAVAAGDLNQKVTSELNGEMGGLKSTINTMVDQLNTFAAEVSRVAKEVGTDGILGGQALVPN